jgi:hypothetical protein
MNVDFKNLEFHQYLIIGAAALVIVSVLLYFLKGRKLKISPFAATIMGCLALGFGAGVVTLASVGYDWNEKTNSGPEPPDPSSIPPTPKKDKKGRGKNGPMTMIPSVAFCDSSAIRSRVIDSPSGLPVI